MKLITPTREMKGLFRIVLSEDADEKLVKKDTGYFSNLITNVGLDSFGLREGVSSSAIDGFRDVCGNFVVGSGSTPPLVTDTALEAPVAYAPIGGASPVLESQSSNYANGYYEIVVRHQFTPGQATGNLSEIGMQRGVGGRLWSRALILDGNGDPTTITVLPIDFLTCYYTLRVPIQQQDTTFNITQIIDGDPIPTVVTARPLAANSVDTGYGWGFRPRSTGSGGGSNNGIRWANSGLAAPTSGNIPGWSGANEYQGAGSSTYTEGTYERYITWNLGTTEMVGTFNTVAVASMLGAWQFHFDPPITKTSEQEMSITFGYSWARA